MTRSPEKTGTIGTMGKGIRGGKRKKEGRKNIYS